MDHWNRPRFALEAGGQRRCCSSLGCGRFLDVLSDYDPEHGSQCGLCDLYQAHATLLCMHHAQYIPLASCRSTSSLLTLVRGGFLRDQLADMLVGTLKATIQNYKVRLQRVNMRKLLCGRAYGFRPIFQLKLDQVWREPDHPGQRAEDMLDCVMMFIRPFTRPTWREMQGTPNWAR